MKSIFRKRAAKNVMGGLGVSVVLGMSFGAWAQTVTPETPEAPETTTAAPKSTAADEKGADAAGKKKSDVFELGTVSVYGEPESSAEKMETKVDREDIELFEKKDVGQALSRMPGVIYQPASGNRYESNVSIRGFTSSGSVPIYIDGVPAYVPYDGYIDLGRFKTADVASIQVAKGYSSVIYGPNTLGGVINIVSLRPTKALDGNATVGVSSGNGREAEANLGTLQNKWYMQLGVSYYEQQYIKTADAFDGKDAAKEVKDTDHKNYRTEDKKVSMKLGYVPNATDEYALSFLKQWGEKGPQDNGDGFRATTWNWPVWDRETVAFVSNVRWDKDFYIKPRVFYDTYKNALVGFGGSSDASRYDDYSWGTSLEAGTEVLRNNVLKALLYYKFDNHGEYSAYGTSYDKIPNTDKTIEQKIFSAALEDTYSFTKQWEIQAGVAYSQRKTTSVGLGNNMSGLIDNYPGAESSLTPDINTVDPQAVLFYKPNDTNTFHYSIAKKTKFPTMKQQFSNYGAGNTVSCVGANCPSGGPFPLVSLQNPDLKPEQAVHQEMGYDGTPLRDLFVQASVFYSRNKNTIGRSDYDFWTYPGYAVSQTVNITGDVERKGVDLGAEYQAMNNVRLGLSYSYLISRDKDDPNYHFVNLPKNHGSLFSEIGVGDWLKIIPAVDLYNRSYYDTKGVGENPGAALAALKILITPPMYKNFVFSVGADNLFNKDYRGYSDIYPSQGRFLYANLRATL